MVLEEREEDIEGGGTRPPGLPTLPSLPPAPAPAAAPTPSGLFGLGDLLNLLKSIFAYIQGGVYEYVKPGTTPFIQQYTLGQAGFQLIYTIPSDALEWELLNANTLTGIPTGFLDWAYTNQAGNIGTGTFNEIAAGQSVARKLAGVSIYVRPQTVGQVCILEITRP